MRAHHICTAAEEALLVATGIQTQIAVPLRFTWPTGKALPKSGDALAIHSDDKSVRVLVWVRDLTIEKIEPLRTTLLARVGVRSLSARPAY